MNTTEERIEQLERELHLKQLQTNGLLNITQAINDNLSSEDLYLMYRSILNWEMGVNHMALYVNTGDNHWTCQTQIGIEDSSIPVQRIIPLLLDYKRNRQIDSTDPFLSQFTYVIPVLHKEQPIAYALLGELKGNSENYHKLQFITTITNVIAVAIENKRLFNQQLEQEMLKRDMLLAREIQQLMIPDELPDNAHYTFSSLYQPHFSVGGDYYDYICEGDTITFCVADIAGKGVVAALLMANFQALFRTIGRLHERLDDLLRALNVAVLNLTHGERHLTLFLAKYNTKTRLLEYIAAGHQPPLLVMDGQLHTLDKGCTILGFFDELPKLEVGQIHIRQEALLLMFTDGLTDIKNVVNGEFLSIDKLENFALQYAKLDAHAFNKELFDMLARFTGTDVYPDDLTVLTCRFST